MVTIRQRYIVAATPRSGSSLLCEGLMTTGVAGRPAEVFAPDFADYWRQHLGIGAKAAFSDYLEAAQSFGTTRNGVYGLKIQWMHVPLLAVNAGASALAGGILDSLFPKATFVNIIRRDRRGQAVSWLKAIQSHQWWQFRGQIRPPAQLTFDAAGIVSLEREIEQQQASWETYFRERAITPLTVEYEQLRADYRQQVGNVLAFLGLDREASACLPPPRLVRQSDGVNQDWKMKLAGT